MDGKYNKAFEGSLTDTTDTKNVSVDLVLQGVPTSFGWETFNLLEIGTLTYVFSKNKKIAEFK